MRPRGRGVLEARYNKWETTAYIARPVPKREDKISLANGFTVIHRARGGDVCVGFLVLRRCAGLTNTLREQDDTIITTCYVSQKIFGVHFHPRMGQFHNHICRDAANVLELQYERGGDAQRQKR